MNETPIATAAAFLELRDVARSRDEWSKVEVPYDTDMPDDVFIETLNAADDAAGGTGELARAVGVARANTIIGPRAESFEGDPFRFLKEGAALVFEDRANFGACSVELSPKRALLRIVAPDYHANRMGETLNRAPMLAAAFLERAIVLIAGEEHVARYIGHAPRIDSRFDRPMVNLMFEFELDEG